MCNFLSMSEDASLMTLGRPPIINEVVLCGRGWPVALLGFSVRLIRSEEGECSHVDPRLHTEDSLSQAL